jgi:subtilase family serine protease
VVGVGGTTLSTVSGAYGGESGWSGSGGGLSKYYSQPSYQKGVVTQTNSFRSVPDVAMDADPNSGVPVYDTYDNGSGSPWVQVGGTSLAAPMWAGVIAIANQGRALGGQGSLDGQQDTLPKLYSLPSTNFHDVTTGSNGYPAQSGYDLVTGRGTPIVNQLVSSLAGSPSPSQPPSIGSFTITPNAVVAGSSVSLTAVNVTETGGTITGLKFFRESNGTTGLQIGTDTLIGSGTATGSTWTLTTSTTGLAPGTYTFYAVANDARGVASAVASATLTVTAIPTIGSFTISPNSATVGTPVSLTAVDVTETAGTITSVKFYRESNTTTGLQIGSDALVGIGAQSGNTWSLTASTTGLAAGSYTFYAVASDAKGVSSAVYATTLTLKAPPSQFNRSTSSNLSCSVTYLGANEMVSFTVKVSVAAGQLAPTGRVNFYMYGQLVGYGNLTPTSGGATATLNLVLVGHGYVTFSTYYGGDSNYDGSASTLYKYV